MALNSFSSERERGGGGIDRSTHVWKSRSDTFPFIMAALSRARPTGNWRDFLSRSLSLVSTDKFRGPSECRIETLAGITQTMTFESILFLIIDSSTKLCASSLFFDPPYLRLTQSAAIWKEIKYFSRSVGTSRAIVTIVWTSRCDYRLHGLANT